MWTLIKAFLPQLLVPAVILALSTGGYFYLKHSITAQCNAHWEQQIAIEKERITAENFAALNASRRRAAELQAENDKLEETLNDINDKAAADPDANSPSLGPDSVQRLNRVH